MFALVVVVLLYTVSTFAQERSWSELNAEALALYQQGRYPEAAKAAKELLTVVEKAFGPDDPRMATLLNNLAAISQA
jgi:hypothetical protein